VERPQATQRVLGWFVLIGATLQFFLAGLAVFRAKPHNGDKLFESSAFDAHRAVGYVLILVSFALLVLAIVNREQVRLAAALFLLMLLQYALAAGGSKIAALGALHPVNGVLILVVAHFLARGPGHPDERRGHRRKRGDPEHDTAAPTEPVRS
jgi:cytochrome b561